MKRLAVIQPKNQNSIALSISTPPNIFLANCIEKAEILHKNGKFFSDVGYH